MVYSVVLYVADSGVGTGGSGGSQWTGAPELLGPPSSGATEKI